MKSKIIPIVLALAGAGTAQAGLSPIAIAPGSFNQNVVVPASALAPPSQGVTATTDGGTNVTGNVFYERGYNTAAPTTGMPVHGSLVTNVVNAVLGLPNHIYQMPPDYHLNNAIVVGHANGGRTPLTAPATLTVTTPTAYSGLSFLTTAGNGPVNVNYTIHYADASTDTGTFAALDWFNNTNYVFNCAGRVNVSASPPVYNNVNGNPGGVVYAADVTVPGSAKNITSIDFFYKDSGGTPNTNNNGRAFIFAVSGALGGSTDFTNTIPVTGFTYDAVMAADDPPITGPTANLTNNVTATMDGGLARTGNTWYEPGYYGHFPNSGMPAAGSTISSATLPATYTLPSTYAGNNAVFLAQNVSNANVTLAAPASYGGLSLLCGAANGDTFLNCIVQYQDGTSQTNALFVPDWFNRVVPWAYINFGRVNVVNRSVNSTPDQFVDPFVPAEPLFDRRGLGMPVPRLFDSVVPLTSAVAVTNIALNFTNGPASGRTVAIFALSGAAAGSTPPVFGFAGTPTPGQPGQLGTTTPRAVLNAVTQIKNYEGTNLVLTVTNIAGDATISYQWMTAARGEGWIDKFYHIDYTKFANVVNGGRVSGATTSALTISNANVGDSADFLVVASNAGGSVTSFVATVMMLSTNANIQVGVGAGDTITRYTIDGSTAAEDISHVDDLVAQKWISDGIQFPGTCCAGPLPFVGPIGYVVVPVSGASFVTGMRFFTANDTTGRDPYDYGLEGSNDGSTWTLITGGQLKGTLGLPTGRNGTGSAGLDPLAQNLVEVAFPNATSYKQYRVSITNNVDTTGDTLMQIAEIELLGNLVPAPPTWVRQPVAAATVYVGTSPQFTAAATGFGLLTPHYQWYKNTSTLIAGATTTSYTVTNAQLVNSGTTYSCVATNPFGQITSSSATLTVVTAPTQPYPAAVLADHPIGYWRLNEADNAAGNDGAITHDYAGAHNGYYSNVVLNVAGYNPSADPDTAGSFSTFVVGADSYVAQIEDVDFVRNTNATAAFSVEAWVFGVAQLTNAGIVAKGYNGALLAGTGTGTEQYALDVAGPSAQQAFRFLVRDAAGNAHVAQSGVLPNDANFNAVWHHLLGVCDQPNGNVYLYVDGLLAASGTIANNVGILNQPRATTIGSRQQTDASDFTDQWAGTVDDVAIYASALSSARALAHYYAGDLAPRFTLVPVNTDTNENTIALLTSSAYGPGTVTYQWWNSDGTAPTTPIGGQTSSNYAFTATPALNNNWYQVIAANAFGSVTSPPVQLTVESGAPGFKFADLPAAQTVFLGHVIQLHVAPSGTAPFTYQWQCAGTNLVDDFRTAGSQTSTLTIGYAGYPDTANYQCLVTGTATTPSTLDALTVTTNASGFFYAAANNADWTLNGGATLNGQSITLTVNAGNTARSGFLNVKQNIASFTAQYTYQEVLPNPIGGGGADGVTFCIQNQAVTALGGGGGNLAYGGITPSVGLALNVYQPQTRGMSFFQNGTVVTPFFSMLPNVGVGDNNDPIQVNVSYNGTVLTATFKDTVTSGTFTTNITVNIPSIVGASTAWVGFTGADGGVNSQQVISWSTPVAVRIPLTVQRVGGNVVLSWPASAGAYLQMTPSVKPTTWTYDNVDTFRVVGANANVTVPPSAAGNYFRLQIFP